LAWNVSFREKQEDKTKEVIFILFIAAAVFLAVASPVSAQEMSGITVEEDYPLESMTSFLVREWGQAVENNRKMESLAYLRDAISHGEKGPAIQTALDSLALEGVINQTRENGRLINYPDIRTQAAILLGEIGTPEAYDTLIRLIQAEYEPMVITEAILSLTKIGITNKAVRVISQALIHFDILFPDNRMAYAALEAFDSLAKKNNGKLDQLTLSTIIRISEGRYSGMVRARTKTLIADLRQY
jgi:hypothetical protein